MTFYQKVQSLPPVAHSNRNSPALDLTKLRVSHIHNQREAGHPHAHLQLGAEETVGKIQEHLAVPPRLFAVDINIVAAFGHLVTPKNANNER